jgi:hypothetical protein
MLISLFLLALTALSTRALPTSLQARSVSPLSADQIKSFDTYTYYTSAVFCDPSTTLTWTCGPNCDANPHFKPVASGGDGANIQYWYVGYDPDLKTVIVAHQGTDPTKILPVITDANFFLRPLDTGLFPGISSDVQVHSGFGNTHSRAAPAVLAAVQKAMSTYNATKVTMVGHSLGSAISMLDSIYLPLHLPAGTTFKTVLYGTPRVGNKAFADYVDKNTSLTFVNNKKDIVPSLPPRTIFFVRPAGEIHITDNDSWVSCSGQDNTDPQCQTGAVPNFTKGDAKYHRGPFNGITVGC